MDRDMGHDFSNPRLLLVTAPTSGSPSLPAVVMESIRAGVWAVARVRA
jgi:hypothetical protein